MSTGSIAESARRAVRWGPDDREILRLAFPALGALTAEPLYVLVDTAVVGHLGTPQLGGLALASSLLLIGHALFTFLAYGTTGAVARLLGAGEDRRAAHQAVQSVWLAALVGVALTIVGIMLSGRLVDVIGGDDPEVRTNALIYLRISLFGFPALLVTLAGVGYLRGLQDTRRPFVVALGSALFNLVLELILVFGFGFGIGASALSTVIAQLLAAAAYIVWIQRAVAEHGVGLLPDLRVIRRLAIAGFDLFIRTSAMRAGLIVTTAVAARIGTDDLAGHQITFEVWSVLALALDAIAIAGQALIGRALGAGDAVRSRQLGRRMLEWGLAAGVVLGLLVLALAPWLPSVFTDDDAVRDIAVFLLLITAVAQPVNGVVFSLDGILIGAGDLRFLAWAMLASSVVLISSGVSVLAFDAGIGWLWAGLQAWMLTRLVLLAWRFRGDAWLVTGAER